MDIDPSDFHPPRIRAAWRRLVNRRRQRVIFAVTTVTFILIPTLYVYYKYFNTTGESWTKVLTVGLGGIAFSALFFNYLGDRDLPTETYRIESTVAQLEHDFHRRLAEITTAVSTIQFDATTKKELIEQTKQSIIDSARDEILHDIRKDIEEDYMERKFLAMLSRIPERLDREIWALRKRSNINLFFGIVLGICGLAMLWGCD